MCARACMYIFIYVYISNKHLPYIYDFEFMLVFTRESRREILLSSILKGSSEGSVYRLDVDNCVCRSFADKSDVVDGDNGTHEEDVFTSIMSSKASNKPAEVLYVISSPPADLLASETVVK